jgi:hypothetical protein
VGHLERMKRGSDMKDRDDRSISIEILTSDTFVKIKPTDPLRLSKQSVYDCDYESINRDLKIVTSRVKDCYSLDFNINR